jgi:hypothetical protein
MRSLINRVAGHWLYDQASFRFRTLLDSDESFVRRGYRRAIGVEPNLRDPQLFCEKITWLNLFYRRSDLPTLADKYLVREYVATRVGEKCLNELVGVYQDPVDIRWQELPGKFALKSTHGCKWNIIVSDKDRVDPLDALAKLRWWHSLNYYWFGREWVYRPLKPRIICEHYLGDASGRPPSDVKIFCFQGIPRLIQVDADRFVDHRRGFFTTNWEPLDAVMTYPRLSHTLQPPATLDRMLDIAERLAHGLPFVRVDLYEHQSNVVFGELTLFPGRGAEPFLDERDNAAFGGWINLPEPCLDRGFLSRLGAVL